jgi:hypothetical protein
MQETGNTSKKAAENLPKVRTPIPVTKYAVY